MLVIFCCLRDSIKCKDIFVHIENFDTKWADPFFLHSLSMTLVVVNLGPCGSSLYFYDNSNFAFPFFLLWVVCILRYGLYIFGLKVSFKQIDALPSPLPCGGRWWCHWLFWGFSSHNASQCFCFLKHTTGLLPMSSTFFYQSEIFSLLTLVDVLYPVFSEDSYSLQFVIFPMCSTHFSCISKSTFTCQSHPDDSIPVEAIICLGFFSNPDNANNVSY